MIRAVQLGLKQIAITDHGFRHFVYNVRRMDWPVVRREVAFLRTKYPQIEILLGLETNINSFGGNIDIKEADVEVLDVVLAAYHKSVLPANVFDIYKFSLPNLWAGVTKKSSAKLVARNTDAYIKAIEKYDIDVIAHPNFGIKFDILEVARACARFGTMMELSGRKIKMTDAEIEAAADAGVYFIMNSDAHKPDDIGRVDAAVETVRRIGLPFERVANWDKLPVFRSRLAKLGRTKIFR